MVADFITTFTNHYPDRQTRMVIISRCCYRFTEWWDFLFETNGRMDGHMRWFYIDISFTEMTHFSIVRIQLIHHKFSHGPKQIVLPCSFPPPQLRALTGATTCVQHENRCPFPLTSTPIVISSSLDQLYRVCVPNQVTFQRRDVPHFRFSA